MQTVEEEACAASAQNLRPLALRKMKDEVRAMEAQKRRIDPRTLSTFLTLLKSELERLDRVGRFPVVVYEERSRHQHARTPTLVEGLQFLIMTGRTALIMDEEVEPGDPEKGYYARLFLF